MSFSLGVDGIALVLIALTAVLVPAVVIASWSDRDRLVDAEAPATAGGGRPGRRRGRGAPARPAGRGTTTAVAGPAGGRRRPGHPRRLDTVLVTDADTAPPRVPGTRRGQPKTFFGLLLLLEVMMIGVFAATDVFLFYVFFEAMLIPMYFLIGSFGGPRRQYAAVKFFLYSLLGGLIMLAAVIGLYFATSARTFAFSQLVAGNIDPGLQKWLFLGFFIAFAIKAPLVPFHTWLPDAGAEAPVGGAALLVGVLDKVGTFGFLRYCLPLFPDASRYFAPMVLVLSVVGILYAALLAMGQKDMKRLVAYTSVAHFGFIGLGIFAFTTQALSGATFYMVNHGLSTGALFLVVGMLIARGGSRMIADYGGVQKVAPILAGLFLVDRAVGAGAAGHVDVRQRVPGAARHLLPAPGVRDHRDRRHHPGRALHPAAGPADRCTGRRAGWPTRGFRDLVGREVWAIAPLIALILFLGVYPKPVLDMINPAVARTMQDAGQTDPAPAVPAGAQNGGGR